MYSSCRLILGDHFVHIAFEGRRHSLRASVVMNTIFGGLQYLEKEKDLKVVFRNYETSDPLLEWWQTTESKEEIYKTEPELPLSRLWCTKEEIARFGLTCYQF